MGDLLSANQIDRFNYQNDARVNIISQIQENESSLKINNIFNHMKASPYSDMKDFLNPDQTAWNNQDNQLSKLQSPLRERSNYGINTDSKFVKNTTSQKSKSKNSYSITVSKMIRSADNDEDNRNTSSKKKNTYSKLSEVRPSCFSGLTITPDKNQYLNVPGLSPINEYYDPGPSNPQFLSPNSMLSLI